MARKRIKNAAKARRAWDKATRKARVAERAFVRAVTLLQRSIAVTYENRLGPLVKRLSTDAKGKPGGKEVKALERLVHARIAPKMQVAYARMAESVDDASEAYAIAVGIGALEMSLNVQKQIERRRDESIKLVEDAHRAYAADVRDVFGDPKNTGLRVEVLQAKLLDRGNVWASRAELIARDQTTKLLGGLNEARQREAGITQYAWCTSRDDRVRGDPSGQYPNADPSHYALDGQIFSWDDPPEPGPPGSDFQCRCSATPILGG